MFDSITISDKVKYSTTNAYSINEHMLTSLTFVNPLIAINGQMWLPDPSVTYDKTSHHSARTLSRGEDVRLDDHLLEVDITVFYCFYIHYGFIYSLS